MHASLRSRTILTVQYASLITALLVASRICAQKKEDEPAERKAVNVKVEGGSLSFVPVDISPRRRNARSEALLLKKATALLTTSKISTYRRKELSPRKYRLTLESKDSKRWFLLFWPEEAKKAAPGTKTKETKETKETKKRGDKSRDEVPPALRVPLLPATVASEDHRVVFELKPIEKGKRVRITVRAGSTQLTGALRWKEEAKG